ncbi:unnamed protein product [Clavelina lepadiformis]|uniref:PDZ domain-containing protein n=1 Tax=Clavelina lepadiformis TaxID=159417 RepID=A0ABP0FA40_CLALP
MINSLISAKQIFAQNIQRRLLFANGNKEIFSIFTNQFVMIRPVLAPVSAPMPNHRLNPPRSVLSTVSGAADLMAMKPRVINLNKSAGEFGFCLLMNKDSPMHIICDIARGSEAERVGLRNGDIVACVNGCDVMHMSHTDCVQEIRNYGDSLELTVAPRRTMEILYQHNISFNTELLDENFERLVENYYDTSTNVVSGRDNQAFVDDLNEESKTSFLMKTDRPNREPTSTEVSLSPSLLAADTPQFTFKENAQVLQPYRDCHVKKQPSEEFEFFLENNTARGGQVIRSLTPGGPAERCGLTEGDRVIEVNGVNVANKNHSDVVALIRKGIPNNEIYFKVVNREADIKAKLQSETNTCVIS